ncbi:hypothetical protein MCG98_18110 [Ruminococcus sp. OA3]|uniref:hypothetical protein n=1 Tax=Ruminococcus sp. OA3 TaxID=2914164 RepID=UPI001F063597|nr:hypothetical protein [Ruminococcus sp. OA3]MCH1984470.1 hypothetical protein [Ruminococcus sp. OA3]
MLLEDTIKVVKEAETKSGEVVKEAEEKAQAMILNAKEDAVRIVAERMAQARGEASRRLAAEQENGKILEEQSLQEADKLIAGLKETASQKESEAVRLLISEVI